MAQKQSGVVIIGGGIMGGDIATIFAAGNWRVHVMSPSAKTRDALPARLRIGLEKLGAAAANAALSEHHKQQIRQLATHFPRLWNDPATPPRERKRIARLLIEDVTLTKTDQVNLHVRFRGGQTTTLTIPKPLNSWQQRQTPADTIALIDQLLDKHTDTEIAAKLNQSGHHSGMNQPFNRTIIIKLRRSHNLPSHHERLRARGMLTHEEIAKQLDAHPRTIHAWRHAGLLTAHKANDRNTQLYEPPEPDDPRLTTRRGWRLSQREPTPSTPGGAM